MKAGKWFVLKRERDPAGLPYRWPDATRRMWKAQLKERIGYGIRKFYQAWVPNIQNMDPPPAIFVMFPQDYAMSGHLASVRKVWENLHLHNYDCLRNNVSMRTPGKYFGAGMVVIWTKYVLRKLAEQSPVLQPIWNDLHDLPPKACGIYLADPPDPGWLESIRKDEPRMFEEFREARHLDKIGLDLAEPQGEVKRRHGQAVDLLVAGKYEEGEAILLDISSARPDYWRAYWDLAVSAFNQGDLGRAHRRILEAQKRYPASLYFDRLAVDCAIRLKDWRRAEWHLKRLWGLNPWNPNLMIRYARVAFAQDSYVLAAKLYEECAEHGPLSWSDRFSHGTALSKINRIGEALALFKDMEEEEPQNAMLLNNIGMTLAGVGRPGEGLDYCRRALEATPDLDCAWDSLGFVHLKMGNYPEARRAFLKAVELGPAFPDAWRHLLHVYHQTGDAEHLEKAKAYVGRVLPGELNRFEREKGSNIRD